MSAGKVIAISLGVLAAGGLGYYFLVYKPKNGSLAGAGANAGYDPNMVPPPYVPEPERGGLLGGLDIVGMINALIPPPNQAPGSTPPPASGGNYASPIGKSFYATANNTKVYAVDLVNQKPKTDTVRRIANKGDLILRVKAVKDGWYTDGSVAVPASYGVIR